jgi:hypothetical protein
MDYRVKLLELVSDLNKIASNKLLFSDYNGREFVINIKEGMVNEDGVEKDAIDVMIDFREEGEIFPIQRSRLTSTDGIHSDEFFEKFYFEFLRMGILGHDSIDIMKEAETGINISFLNFRTLLNEGLEKLKTKT